MNRMKGSMSLKELFHAGFLASVYSLLLLHGEPLPAQTDTMNVAIPFEFIRNKTILPVTIGNSRVLKIILDSGMDYDGLLIMNPELQDSIQMVNRINARIGGGGSGPDQYAFFSDSMSFSAGNAGFSNQRVIVLQGDSFKGSAFDGVVGYSLFGHFLVEINNDNNTIILHKYNSYKVNEMWSEIPIYFNQNNIPRVDILVSTGQETPVKLSCYIDYASSEALELLQKVNQKFIMPAKTEKYYLGRGLSGDIHGSKGIISKVIIGPYQLDNINAAIAPYENRSKQAGADGIIANSLLRRFNMIFDYQNKKLFIKPGSHFNDPFK